MPPIDEAYLRDFPDRAIRKLLENRENLRELVADLIPDLVESFDFERAELPPRGFLLEDWRGRESDLLFRVPFHTDGDEREVLVCLLVEHESGPDPRMPLRILVYAVLYWEKQWKAGEDEHAEGEPLRISPVLPIVFHTGRNRWSTHRELAELIEGPEGVVAVRPAVAAVVLGPGGAHARGAAGSGRSVAAGVGRGKSGAGRGG